MSVTETHQDQVERIARWLESEYRDEISHLAQRYPKEQAHLTLSWGDLYRFDQTIADRFLEKPVQTKQTISDAVAEIHVPNVKLEGVDVRVVDLNREDIYQPIEILKEDPTGYVGVSGELAKVSAPKKEIDEAAFECARCGTMTHIKQSKDSVVKPHECVGCERQGPFRVDFDASTFRSHSKVRIETPPDETGALQSDTMDGDVRGDLVWSGHEDVGIAGRSGDAVTAYGRVQLKQINEDDRHFEAELDIDALQFDSDADDTDIEAHRDTFTEYASRDDAVDLYAQSIVPELYATAEWEHGLELLVAYLFGAPRIDVPGGPTYRGDIHVLIISDYGMGKSMVNSAVALYSPKVIKESVTGLSSDVGLLAAAVEDDFAGSTWTLRPGILVRANGGHVILDEIDKTDANLERMNDALEGEQIVDVNKAGQSATFKSRVGLLATGNPENSRFETTTPNSQQLNIDQSLLSRFDGIVLMEDKSDPEQDSNIARTQLESYIEGQELIYGDRDEADTLSREIEPEVGRAWIAHARENVHPILSRDHVDEIREWYADEVRQLNNEYGDGGDDMPVPANARSVMATIRFSVAFARVHLREKVADEDVKRAMRLSKALIGQNFDGEKFVAAESQRTPRTQEERINRVKSLVDEHDDGEGAPVGEVLTAAHDQYDMAVTKTEDEIEKLRTKGELYEPQNGHLKTS